MKILVINNDGGGFADYVEVAAGTTVTIYRFQYPSELFNWGEDGRRGF